MHCRALPLCLATALVLSLGAPSISAKVPKAAAKTALAASADKRRSQPRPKRLNTLKTRLKAFKSSKVAAIKIRFPKLQTNWKKAVERAAPFVRGATRVGLMVAGSYFFYKGGAHILDFRLAQQSLYDPIGIAYIGTGVYLKMMSTMPKLHFGKRLKLGLLGAHETKLALALAVYTADPTMTAGALMLAGHGLVKLRHTLNAGAHPPAH